MFDNEIQSIQNLIEEQLELAVWNVNKYATYRITSYNGQQPNNILLISYYYDQSYLPFDNRTPDYAGKLTIIDKGPQDNYDRYGALAAGTYKIYTTQEAANQNDGYVEGQDLISIRDILAWGYMCTYPNGNSVNHPINDETESYQKADESLGW